MKKLWVALVEHNVVPGVRAAVFFQAQEPGDKAIKARFKDDAKPSELQVTHVMDMSHTAGQDIHTYLALQRFAVATWGSA